MDAGVVVFDRLAGQTNAATRIYPLILPQQPTYPAITYQQISSIRTHAMAKDGPMVRVRMQVNCWGRTYAEAHDLAAQVRQRLSRFRGEEGGITVLDVLLDNEIDSYESDPPIRRVIQDYTIFITE